MGQPLQQFIFTHLGPRDGLSSDEVMAVQQDKKGFLWIATMNGLQRYDGQRFITFYHRAGDPNSILNNSVAATGFGGGIYLLGTGNLTSLINNTISGNTAWAGGGIFSAELCASR